MNQHQKSHKWLWLTATVISALYIILMGISVINKLIGRFKFGFTDLPVWIIYSDIILVLLLILGFILALIKKPGAGGILIIIYAVMSMIVLLAPYYHSLAAASLVLPLLAAGILYVIYWRKNISQ